MHTLRPNTAKFSVYQLKNRQQWMYLAKTFFFFFKNCRALQQNNFRFSPAPVFNRILISSAQKTLLPFTLLLSLLGLTASFLLRFSPFWPTSLEVQPPPFTFLFDNLWVFVSSMHYLFRDTPRRYCVFLFQEHRQEFLTGQRKVTRFVVRQAMTSRCVVAKSNICYQRI